MPGVHAYLLVYMAEASRGWLDRGHDPDLRALPLTWGTCRPDVRRYALEGSQLFFLGYDRRQPQPSPYMLTAYFHVAERILQKDAVQRFPGRPNVILDRLPPGPSLDEQVLSYIRAHRDHLCWPDEAKDRAFQSLEMSGGDRHAMLLSFVTPLAQPNFVHAHWDAHADWRKRICQRYFVADSPPSAVLDQPLPYDQLTAACRALPPRDTLRSGWGATIRADSVTRRAPTCWSASPGCPRSHCLRGRGIRDAMPPSLALSAGWRVVVDACLDAAFTFLDIATVADLTGAQLAAYRAYFTGSGLAPASQAQALAALRAAVPLLPIAR